MSQPHVSSIPLLVVPPCTSDVSRVGTNVITTASSSSAFYRETSTVPSTASATCASCESKLAQGSSATLLPQSNAAERAGRTSSLAVELVKQRVLRLVRRSSNSLRQPPLRSTSVPISKHSHRAASPVTTAHNVPARSAHRCRSCTGSGNASGCRFGQPPTVQMTCKFIGTSTKPTLGAAQARSLWCGNGDSLSSTSRPQENVSSAACHHCGEGYRSRCNAPYRCVEPPALPSSPPVSVSATTGVRVRNATQSSLFGVMGAALTDAAGPADAWISGRVNKTATPLGELNPPSSTVGVLAGMVGSPLSDGTAAPAVLRVCKCRHCRAAPLAAVNVFSIGATNSSRCMRSSSPSSESSVSRIIDTNTPELPCRRLSPSEDRGGGEEPSGVNLLALLTSASSSSCEGFDVAAAVAPRGPGMRYLEPTGKPASQWRPPDALLNVALSAARDCEVLDRAGDGGAEGDSTPQTPDVCEHRQAHAFRRLSLTDGRVWDAAAPHIRHTSAGKVVMVPDDSSRCYPEAAPASLQKEVEKTHCDDRGAPSWMLDTSTAPHLSLPVMLRGGRGDADNRVPPATAQPTPSLPLNLSHTSGSCVLVNTGLGSEPSSTALTTPACVAMTVPEAPPMATTRRRSFNSDTSLLDSFRVVLSPCPCSIAPVFSLVPFRATSPVSIPARAVQQRWREHVRARTGVGVWNAGGGTTPLIGAAAPSPCSPAERALKPQVTPHSLHAAKILVSDIAAGGSACDAARFKSLQGWEPPPSRRSSGADDANAVPTPKSCSPSSSGAASGGWESVANVRQDLASIPPHDLSACTDPRSSRVHAPTMSLCMSHPYSMALSLDRTPLPTQQQHHHQQHTSSDHSSLVLADTAITKPWPLSLPEHAPSSPLRRRPTETTPLFPSDVGQRGGAGAACAVTAAPQTAGGVCGGSMCTSPSLMTTAMKGAPNTRLSAPSLPSPWSASRTPARSADARVGALWFPMSAATVQCHGGSCHLSPIDEVSYFNSTHRSHRQPSTPTPSLLSFKCPIPASAVEDSFTSSTTFAGSQPRAPLHQFVQTKQRCVPGAGAPMRQLSPLQTSCCADAAGRCVVGEVTAKANTSLEGSTRVGLASTCSTPPQRPLLAPNTPHLSGCLSPSRGAAGTCVWKTTSTSARKPVLSSTSLSRGSPLAGEERVSVSSPWATLQCSSPTAATAVGGPGSEVRMAPTRRCVRRLSCTAAPYPAPVESDIAPLYFGEELELRRLQSVTNVCSPLSISDTSVITAPSPTPHGDSGGLGEGRSALGSFRAHGFSAMPLPPPLPLTALSGSHASPSTSWPRGSFSAPRAAATHAAPTREATHPQCISPQWSSPELRTRTRSASWAAAMSAHEAPAEVGVPSDMLPASDSLTNAVTTTTTTAATEGVPPSMPTPLPAVVPPTMQFHCAFSSLRGCRRTQEDSAMIVNDLRVRLRRRAAAEPITANAPTPVTEAPGGVGAPSDTEAAGEGTEQAEATQSTTRQKEAGPHHIVDAHADVVFQCVGVFDGHCGDGVASFASKFFQEHFEHALQDLQEQVEPDQQEGGGAMRVTRSSTSFREEPVKRPHRDHHEISLADAVHFQRAVSASLVQALMHLDLTCYNLLHNSTRGRPAQCRDAGSTASVAVFFKAPLATALRHSDVSGGISRSSNGTPLLATSDTVERFNGGGLATTCTPAASDGESRRRTGCDEVVPLSPIPTTCVEDTYRLCLANLGDSRAIIGRLDTGILLLSTTDHRISACPTERARIQAAGGVVEFDRIGGSLDVTRGLGDYRYKVAPAQWWASAATSSSTDAPEGFSSMPTGVEGRRTASTTSAMSSSKFEVVEGLVPPASTLRCGDAPAAGDSMMGTLRWQSGSNTPLRSPMSEDADGCEAAIVNLQRGARHVRGAVGEARTVSVTSSCGSHPPGAAEGAANAPVRPQQQQLPQSPLSPLSPPLPSSAEVLTSNAVSNIADVYEWEVHRGEVLIIASDGVWDRMNSEDVLAFVCSALAAARRQPKAPSTGVMSGEEASGDPSNVAGGEGRGLSVFDGVDAQVSSAADVTPLSFGGALACGPLRHPSPCCERRATSSHCSRGAAFCTPGGNEDVGCNEVHSAVASLPGPTGSGLNFSIVQAAARRLTEYVLHNLSGTDNTSAVVVVFH